MLGQIPGLFSGLGSKIALKRKVSVLQEDTHGRSGLSEMIPKRRARATTWWKTRNRETPAAVILV